MESVKISYPVTEELIRQSTKEMFLGLYLKPKIIFGLALLLILAVVYQALFPDSFLPVSTIAYTGFAIIALAWVLTYFKMHSNAVRYFKSLDGDNEQTIVFDEAGIHVRRNEDSKNLLWSKISGAKETKNFIIILSGKLPLFLIPKRELENAGFDIFSATEKI